MDVMVLGARLRGSGVGSERTRAIEGDLEERSGGGWRLRRREERRESIKRSLRGRRNVSLSLELGFALVLLGSDSDNDMSDLSQVYDSLTRVLGLY